MKKIGLIFPGQGAQYVGMGKDLCAQSTEARQIFDWADQKLGFSISKICFEGPEDTLTRTVHAQLAIFVTSLAALTAIRTRCPQLRVDFGCGLSLGEFTALVALEAVSLDDGLSIVRQRGELMEVACQKSPGTMASILNLSLDGCRKVCERSGAEIANINSPSQIVLSGSQEAIARAIIAAKEEGAKRAIPLNVGGAFHSSLMSSAREGLEVALQAIEIQKPNGVFIPNVTGKPVSEPGEIRSLLARQLTSSVEWVQSMRTAAEMGFQELVEVGPGKVLKGLAKKIDSSINVSNVSSNDELEHFSATLSGVLNDT